MTAAARVTGPEPDQLLCHCHTSGRPATPVAASPVATLILAPPPHTLALTATGLPSGGQPEPSTLWPVLARTAARNDA